MSTPSPTPPGRKGRWLGLAAVALVLAAGVVFLAAKYRPAGDGNPARPTSFQDQAVEAGLGTFRMNFLTGEQGSTFKINLYDHGCGVAVGDFDGDGHDDVYFVNQLGPNRLFRNKGDGTFEDVTEKAGVGLGDRVCVAATWADYENNGRPGLYVTSTRGGNVLFHNNGDGTFTDVTEKAGLTLVAHSQTAIFFDFDNDGWLDLLVVNTARWTLDQKTGHYFPGPGDFQQLLRSPTEDNVLYRNNHDGTFTNVTERSGLKGRGWAGDVAVLDYNDDGHPDLLITNMFGPSQLHRNNGDGTFTDVTREVLGRTSWGGVGCKAFASTNDGRLDLLILDMHSDMWMGLDTRHSSEKIAREMGNKKFTSLFGPKDMKMDPDEIARFLRCRPEEVLFGNTFFKNRGGGKFEECSDRVGLETFWPWSAATGDFDNDGHEDVFIPSGMGYPFYYWPNALLMNNGDGTFSDWAKETGVEPPVGGIVLPEQIRHKEMVRSSRCAAVADFDGDGRLEIITNNFNDRPYYFRNHFPKKNYLAVRLTGARRKGGDSGTNRDAIGAVVRLYAGKEVLTRQVNPAGGYLSKSSRTLHFGLGDRDRVDRVEITWPGPGRRTQTIKAPALNKLLEVDEQ
jgi:hypothetical protein